MPQQHNSARNVGSVDANYRDIDSLNLIRGYLRQIELNPSQFYSQLALAEHLSLLIITYCELNTSDFWDERCLSRHWIHDENEIKNKSITPKLDKGKDWRNAFSNYKVNSTFSANYSWTMQVQRVDGNNSSEIVNCFVGVIQRERLQSSHLITKLFCSQSFGYGVGGLCGVKMNNGTCKAFASPFRVADVITMSLVCTHSYYELRYNVNGSDIGDYDAMNDDADDEFGVNHDDDCSYINKHDKVAYRIPRDKIYEMVVALDDDSYKIKCLSFRMKQA